MHHGGGWRSFMQYDESKSQPQVSRQLLGRALAYGRPYWRSLALMLVAISAISLLGLIPPLLYRDLIDNVLPNQDVARLNMLALGMIAIPIFSGLIGVGERYLSARVGEGVIFDPVSYTHLTLPTTPYV